MHNRCENVGDTQLVCRGVNTTPKQRPFSIWHSEQKGKNLHLTQFSMFSKAPSKKVWNPSKTLRHVWGAVRWSPVGKILHILRVLQSAEQKKGVKPVSDTQTPLNCSEVKACMSIFSVFSKAQSKKGVKPVSDTQTGWETRLCVACFEVTAGCGKNMNEIWVRYQFEIWFWIWSALRWCDTIRT